MDSPKPVSDETAWRLAAAYFDAWNNRDREAWLDLLDPELEFRPTALVGTRIVYLGLEGAGRYFDELIASERPELAKIIGLRRIAPDRFLIELELLIDGGAVAKACVISRVREGKFVETVGYLSDMRSLTSTGRIAEDAPTVPRLAANSAA